MNVTHDGDYIPGPSIPLFVPVCWFFVFSVTGLMFIWTFEHYFRQIRLRTWSLPTYQNAWDPSDITAISCANQACHPRLAQTQWVEYLDRRTAHILPNFSIGVFVSTSSRCQKRPTFPFQYLCFCRKVIKVERHILSNTQQQHTFYLILSFDEGISPSFETSFDSFSLGLFFMIQSRLVPMCVCVCVCYSCLWFSVGLWRAYPSIQGHCI